MSTPRVSSGNKSKTAKLAEVDVSEPPPEYHMYALDTTELQALEDPATEAETAAYSTQTCTAAVIGPNFQPIPANFSDLKFNEQYHGKNVIVTVKGTQAERLKK